MARNCVLVDILIGQWDSLVGARRVSNGLLRLSQSLWSLKALEVKPFPPYASLKSIESYASYKLQFTMQSGWYRADLAITDTL